mmetsp:Transcript_12610/g.35182  ORF Transcript_12610/g.35182 Transcript_12610/m.35182 type:complete len:243 (+) Transcript_12610:879-1607(+)
MCPFRVFTSLPEVSHTLACPSYDPVARYLPSELQSKVVTSLDFVPAPAEPLTTPPCPPMLGLSPSLSDFESAVVWFRHRGSWSFLVRSQILAVESPEPLARREDWGFHWMMNTSLVCPLRVVTPSGGIIASGSWPFSSASAPPSLLFTPFEPPALPSSRGESVSMGAGPPFAFFSALSLEPWLAVVLDFLDLGLVSLSLSPPSPPCFSLSRSFCFWDLSLCSFFLCIVLLNSPTSLVRSSSG